MYKTCRSRTALRGPAVRCALGGRHGECRARAPWLPSTLARGSGLRVQPQASDVFGLHDRIAGREGVWSVAPKLFESERGFVIVSQSVKAVGIGGGVQAVHVDCGCSVKPEPVHAVHVVALTSGEAAYLRLLGGD